MPGFDSDAMEIKLHCIVIDGESIVHDSTLPILVPKSLFVAPILDCRGWFAQKMAEKYGLLSVEPNKLKFWMANTPLSVNAPSDSRSCCRQLLDEFQLHFSMIPFMRSLKECLGDAVYNPEVVHFVVTLAEIHLEFVQSPSTDSGPPPVLSIGHYETDNRGKTGRGCVDIKEGERRSEDVIHPPIVTRPITLLGLCNLDVGEMSGSGIEINTHLDNFNSTSMRCHINSWGRTKLYNASVSWLVAEQTPLLQSGSVDSQHYRCDKSQGGDVIKRIEFETPFLSPPLVFVALSGFSLTGDNNWNVWAFANCVDSRGFTINIVRTREGKGLGNGQVHWLAFPEGGIPGVKMCCGELKSSQSRPYVTLGAPSEGHVDFNAGFTNPPKIFLALSQFDFQSPHNLRMVLSSSNVTATGMDWSLSTWEAPKIYSATASFLAVEC